MHVERQLRIVNPKGFHVRPASLVAEQAMKFNADIKVIFDGKPVDAKSAMSLLVIASPQGTEVTIIADGEDAEEAADAIERLFEDGFNEMDEPGTEAGRSSVPDNQ